MKICHNCSNQIEDVYPLFEFCHNTTNLMMMIIGDIAKDIIKVGHLIINCRNKLLKILTVFYYFGTCILNKFDSAYLFGFMFYYQNIFSNYFMQILFKKKKIIIRYHNISLYIFNY